MTSNSDRVTVNVPYLRRYARALTGSQRIGDEYVRACLETLLQEPDGLEGGQTKRAVFRLFHEVWTALRPWPEDEQGGIGGTGRQRIAYGLAALPPVERMVLLLVSLEGFSQDDAAYILDMNEDDVRDALRQAREDVRMHGSVDVLIIEDETVIAMELARVVEEMGHRVCGTAAREDDAVALARLHRPALVLADIQLQDDDSGISAVRNILTKFEMPIIFVTGFPDRLLTGDGLEPAFVIAKPFDRDTLKTAINQSLTILPVVPDEPTLGASLNT